MFINLKYKILFCLGFLVLIMMHQSCTHDPFLSDDLVPDPMDTTTTPIDTMVIDTMVIDTIIMGMPCDSTVIYFESDLLPILKGNCAISGCHDANTATDGVILDTYENVINTAEVIPFNLNDSDLYEVITEDDPDKVMPPDGKLDNEMISLIAQWILQGAENLECDNEPEECNTTDISYSAFVKGAFDTNCNGCHSTTAAFGGVILDTYTGVRAVVNAGRLYGAINWVQGYEPMPQGQNQLDTCTIAKVKSWIDAGAQNN